jgi:hypothetical protein
MKKLSILILFSFAIGSSKAQGFKKLIENVAGKDSAGKAKVSSVLNKIPASKTALSNDEIIAGLKEALSVGTDKASGKLSAVDGFFKDAAIKILMPEESKKAEKKLRAIGMGKLVDDAILSMNRAAEDASKSAAPIFVKAIRQMTIGDAMGILKGGYFAATGYLKDKTTTSLTESFRPVIDSSLTKVNATKYWNAVFTAYNKVSTDKVNPDLAAYVTEKALAGIFHQVGLEEQKIRKDPLARTTDLLKKVLSK